MKVLTGLKMKSWNRSQTLCGGLKQKEIGRKFFPRLNERKSKQKKVDDDLSLLGKLGLKLLRSF